MSSSQLIKETDWQQVVNAIPDLVMILDTQYQVLWLNQAMAQRLGLGAQEVLGKTCYQLVHGTSAPVERCPFATMLADGRTCRTELCEEKLGGMFLISVSPFFNREGRLKGAVHIAHDIGPLKRVEKELRENERRYRTLSEATFEAVFLSENGVCIDANRRTTELFGYEYDELIGISGTELVAPECRERVEHYMLSGYEKPYEVVALKKDGTRFNAEIRGKMMRYKDKTARVAVMRDITEQKRAERALRNSELKYKTLLDNIPDIIFSTDRDGNVIDMHLPGETFFGYERDEIIGRHFSSFVYREDKEQLIAVIRDLLHRRMDYTRGVRCRIVSKNHIPRWVEINLHTRFDDRGIGIQTDGVIRDISHIKKTEAQLKRFNRNLKRAFEKRKALSTRLIELLEKDRRQIAMELHDHMGQSIIALRTGFNTIIGQLKKAAPSLVALVESVEEKTVRELMELKNISYKLRPNMLDHLGLVPSIRTLISDFETASDFQVQFFDKDVPREIEPAVALALYRIVQEALINIAKHARASEVFISLINKGESLALSIEDNGVGFDRQKLAISENGKSLLGIYIMEERAVQVGGDLTIESQPGKGTQVMAEIPL